MQQEMDTQPDSGRAHPPDTVSSSSSGMTNLGAQHRPRSSRSTAQHRQHPYIMKPSTQKPPRVPEYSSFGTDTGVGGPLTAYQRRFTDMLGPLASLLTTPDGASSTQLITPILIPDLTGLITRCSPDPISGGTYGNIYKCIHHGPEGDVEVAVKAIRPQCFSAKTFRRELGIWKRLRHSNILKFMGTTSDFGSSVALVAPWMTNGTLTSFLDQNNRTLSLHDRLLLLRDIAAGLNYLHTFSLAEGGHTEFPVIHGDLTGTNVLIDGDRKAYLADFGLSGTFKKLTGMTYMAKLTCQPGAVRWAAPELLSGEESTSVATTQSDMYSFGNIMLQVLTGKVPWCHLTREFQIPYLVAVKREMHPRPNDAYVTDQHWNFMARCWSITFTDRPPAKEAVQFVGNALHTSTSPQSPTLSISGERTPSTIPQTLMSDERTSITSPQTPTLSTSSDERHRGIARNDYLRGDTEARLPVMQDINSPLNVRENYPGVMLPAYPSTTHTTGLEPSCKTPYRVLVPKIPSQQNRKKVPSSVPPSAAEPSQSTMSTPSTSEDGNSPSDSIPDVHPALEEFLKMHPLSSMPHPTLGTGDASTTFKNKWDPFSPPLPKFMTPGPAPAIYPSPIPQASNSVSSFQYPLPPSILYPTSVGVDDDLTDFLPSGGSSLDEKWRKFMRDSGIWDEPQS